MQLLFKGKNYSVDVLLILGEARVAGFHAKAMLLWLAANRKVPSKVPMMLLEET